MEPKLSRLGRAPGLHSLSPNSVAELHFALDDEHTRACSGQSRPEARTGKSAAYNRQIVIRWHHAAQTLIVLA
jgi:hypothetical protein